MTIVWPDDLKYTAELSSYQLTPHDEIARSDYQEGPPSARRRFSRMPAALSFNVLMPIDQVEAFKAFYLDDLNVGTRWFTMPIWTGSFYVGHLVRFAQRYQIADYDSVNFMRVSFSLSVPNLVTFTALEVDFLTNYGLTFGLDIGYRLQRAVNVTYPNIFA